MTECSNGDVRDALPDYLHDRLAPARRMEVESHLSGCEACQTELALLRDLRATMRRAPVVDVAAIAASIPAYRAPAPRPWASNWRIAAAVVAIAVGGTSIALLQRTSDTTPRDDSVRIARTAPSESTTAVARVIDTTPDVSVAAPRGASIAVPPARGPELAMAGGALGDLSDGDLSTLLSELESFDALPSTEVEGGEPLSPDREGGQ